MQEAISARARVPGRDNLYGRNCTWSVTSARQAGGVPVPLAWMPEQLAYGLPRVLGGQNSGKWNWVEPHAAGAPGPTC